MKTVKIINGAYGQRAGCRTRLVRLGGTCQVDDQEAARLVGLKVAEYVEEEPESVPPAPPTIDIDESGGPPPDSEGSAESEPFSREELDAMTKDSLLGIAVQLGLKVNARMSKADILQVIHNALSQGAEHTPPDLAPEGPVV